jgi:integral membrane sensor domain MASE1
MERNRSWGDQAADTIESVVLGVKEKTTVPLRTAARGVVYGLVLAVVGAVVLVVFVIALVRVAAVWLLGWAGRAHGHVRLSIAYGALGMLFTLAGLWCWSRRSRRVGNRCTE